MGLAKFSQIHLSELKEGDRFYVGNKKNDICEFMRKERKSLRDGYEYFYNKGRNEKSSKKDLVVIYLRNVND